MFLRNRPSGAVLKIYPTAAVVAAVILGSSLPTVAAPLAESGIVHLEYQEGQPRVAPGFKKNYGRYLGSGKGEITGAIKGSLVWDLYEEQSDPKLHRTQFVGRLTSSDGSTASFETTGYFIPRPGGEYWDLTSAVYFSDAKGAAYKELAHRIGLWQGHVDIRSAADGRTTFSHTYRLYLPETMDSP